MQKNTNLHSQPEAGPKPARRTRLYCVGTGKSGTHSIADMFAGSALARHEPQAGKLIHKVLEIAAGKVTPEALTEWVLARDKEMYLEVDSSQLNFYLLETLLKEFPDAKFLLTIRDCYSWLESSINHSLSSLIGFPWTELRKVKFAPDRFTHPPEEEILKRYGLYTLDGYFSNWSWQNSEVLRIVPPERLLVVRTDRISAEAGRIAEFAGLPGEAAKKERSHAFKAPRRWDVLGKIDRAHLEAKAGQYCGPIMSRFFPEVSSFESRIKSGG